MVTDVFMAALRGYQMSSLQNYKMEMFQTMEFVTVCISNKQYTFTHLVQDLRLLRGLGEGVPVL